MIQSFLLVSPIQLQRPVSVIQDFAALRLSMTPVIKCVPGSIDLTTSVVNCVLGDITP